MSTLGFLDLPDEDTDLENQHKKQDNKCRPTCLSQGSLTTIIPICSHMDPSIIDLQLGLMDTVCICMLYDYKCPQLVHLLFNLISTLVRGKESIQMFHNIV